MADEGGDPACWLDRVCEACGALLEDGTDHDCPRRDDVPAPGGTCQGSPGDGSSGHQPPPTLR